MDTGLLMIADIILTAIVVLLLALVILERRSGRGVAGVDLVEIEKIREKVKDITTLDEDMEGKKKRLDAIIGKLDEAIAEIQEARQGVPGSGGLSEKTSPYATAEKLLRQGEPMERVMEFCGLTRGEADLLASMHSMHS